MGVGVGLDPGSDSIKVVQVRSGPGGVSIVAAARVERPPGEPDPATFPASALAGAVRRAGIRRRATSGASGRNLMLRFLAVPPVPPWRLRRIVDFEIRENMAGGGGDVSNDFRPLSLPTGLREGLVVLAAVAKNAYLEEEFDLARGAGVKVNAASPDAVALFRGFAASNEFRQNEATFLLDIGRENVEMAIQKDGDLLFARNLTGSGGEKVTHAIDDAFGIGRDRAETYKRERAKITLQPPPDAEKRQLLVYGALRGAGDAVVSAVTSGLRFARMQTKMQQMDFDRLVLSGGGARLSGLKEFLEARLEKPVTLYDPSAAMDVSRLRGDQMRLFGGAPSEMAVATGLAVMDAEREGFTLSLLPPREIARRAFWGRTAFAYAAAACALVLAGAMFLRARTDLALARSRRESLEAEVGELGEKAGEVRKIEDEARLIRQEVGLFLDEAKVNRAVLELLALQREACPAGLKLTGLELTDAEALAVEFEGQSSGIDEQEFLSRLNDFKTGLERGAVVKKGSVRISQIPVRARKPAKDLRAFKCTVSLDPWADGAEEVPGADDGSAGDASADGAAPSAPTGASAGGAEAGGAEAGAPGKAPAGEVAP